MSALPNSPAKFITECRLCRQPFQAAPFDLKGGLLDNARLARFFDAVSKHLQQKHADYLSAATIAAYATQDPALEPVYQTARAWVARVSRKNIASDVAILDQCARAGLTQEEIDVMSPVMFEMRDYLTEQGKHAPGSIATDSPLHPTQRA